MQVYVSASIITDNNEGTEFQGPGSQDLHRIPLDTTKPTVDDINPALPEGL